MGITIFSGNTLTKKDLFTGKGKGLALIFHYSSEGY
jgi:hypothetical protein